MKAPIIYINGYPGTGKLTIAKALQNISGAKVLDNHSIYNVAFALLEFGSPEFKRVVEEVETVALSAMRHVRANLPIIVTNALFKDSEWAMVRWQNVIERGRQLGRPVGAIILRCSEAANVMRVQQPERSYPGKLTDPEILVSKLRRRPLIDSGVSSCLRLDVSDMTPKEAASKIYEWIADEFPETFIQQGSVKNCLFEQ